MTQFNGMISTMEFKNQKNLMPEQVNVTEIYGGIYICIYYILTMELYMKGISILHPLFRIHGIG